MKGTVRTAVAIPVIGLMSACGGRAPSTSGIESGMATLEGMILEEPAGSGPSGFDSFGTVAATTEVRVSDFTTEGDTEALAEAHVEPGGHYVVQVPAQRQRLVVRAYDAEEHLLASVLVPASGDAGTTTTAEPMTAATSTQAEVFVRMIAHRLNHAKVDLVDLSRRIDSRVATEVRIAAEAGEPVERQLRGLATATLAAQEALRAGGPIGSAKRKAMMESIASAAFRGAMGSELSGSAQYKSLIDASARTQAVLEAREATNATMSRLSDQGAPQWTLNKANKAGATLLTALDAATDAKASAQAFTDFQTEMFDASTKGNGMTEADVQALRQAESLARAMLVLETESAFQTMGDLQTAEAARTVMSAYDSYDAAVREQVTRLMPTMGDIALSTDLLVIAHGAFLTKGG